MCQYCGPNRQPGTGKSHPANPPPPKPAGKDEVTNALRDAGIELVDGMPAFGVWVRDHGNGSIRVGVGQADDDDVADLVNATLADAGISFRRAGGRHGRTFGINQQPT